MAEKSAYDWAELILGAGATITDTVFNSKDKSEVLTDTTQSSNNDEYLDLLKKVAIGVGAMVTVFFAYKIIKNILRRGYYIEELYCKRRRV